MSCPVGHSGPSKQITPNLFRCSAPVVVGLEDDGTQVRLPCGREFHRGPGPALSAPTCSCGNFAVRVCTACGRPLCGDHGVRSTTSDSNGRWQCSSCHRAAETKAREELARGLAAVKERYRRLPPIPEELLVRWLRGDVAESAFIDGETHRADHVSGALAAELVAREVGESPSYLLVLDKFRRHGSFPRLEGIAEVQSLTLGDRILWRDGSVREYCYNSDIGHWEALRHGGDQPFNRFLMSHWMRANGINSEAFIALRRMIGVNRRWVEVCAQAARTPTAEERERRAADRSANLQLVGCLTFILFFVVLTVFLVGVGIYYSP